MKITTELVEALRYNLICFGVRLDGPGSNFFDNKLVVTNTSMSTLMLNKRHSAICQHQSRESQVAGNICVGWIPGERNIADLLTKTTMTSNSSHLIVEIIFHNKSSMWKDDDNDYGRVG